MFGLMSKNRASLDIPKRPTERKQWILFQLKLKGSNFRALGRELGCSHQAVAWAAAGNASLEIEQAIAAKIGIDHVDLFPEHFDDEGERIPLARPRQRKGRPQAENGNVYSREVA
jgi:lambda repressor-like predicted transcriptional regulator